jgi:hypothetical protein
VLMRKRIVIGFLAVVVVGVLAVSLSQPKRESVEWYKQRSEELHAECFGRTFRWKIAGLWQGLTGRALIKVTEEERDKQWEELQGNLEKLEKLGFLTRREYIFSNLPPHRRAEMLLRREIQVWRRSIPEKRQMFCWVLSGGEYRSGEYRQFLWVVAPRGYQPEWEGVVRKLDVAKSEK